MKALQPDMVTHAHRFGILRSVGQTLYSALIVAGAAGALDANANMLQSGDAVVLHWNEVAVKTVGPTPPFPSSRAMAIVQLAVFEAVNAITRRYRPYLGTLTAPTNASTEAAAATAAHDTLVWLFPTQSRMLAGERDASLSGVAEGAAKNEGIVLGQAAAAAIIAVRANDGAQSPLFYTPAGTESYAWQPTPSCANGPANGRGLFFHWQFVKPFGIESSSQFRAKAPPALGHGSYARDLNEVKAVGDLNSTLRPADRAAVAKLYAAQPPHRAWNLVARQLAAERGTNEITRTARTFAIMNMSLSDVHITVFESKYRYRTWRPETAIHRADDDGNAPTDASASYQPYVVAPCFPSYPSAHGAGGGAARAVLERAYGRKHHNITNADDDAPGIVLRYSDLRAIVDDVSDARVYGGIHFRFDQDAGERMGLEVGDYNDDHELLPFDEAEWVEDDQRRHRSSLP